MAGRSTARVPAQRSGREAGIRQRGRPALTGLADFARHRLWISPDRSIDPPPCWMALAVTSSTAWRYRSTCSVAAPVWMAWAVTNARKAASRSRWRNLSHGSAAAVRAAATCRTRRWKPPGWRSLRWAASRRYQPSLAGSGRRRPVHRDQQRRYRRRTRARHWPTRARR